MNKIYKFMALVLGTAVLTTGCIKETFPTSGATQEQVEQSSSALDAMVGAIAVNMAYPYSAFGSSNNYGFDFGYPGLMCATDACTGDVICTAGDEASGYDWFWYWEYGYMIGPTMPLSSFPWATYCSFIKNCNDVINVVGSSTELSLAAKSALGAAKAIRACIYLDMARQFEALECPGIEGYNVTAVEGLTVPIITEATTEEIARNNPRATRKEIFEFILGDLSEAEALLKDVTTDKTLPSLAVVYGLKARAYLWLGGFSVDNNTNEPTEPTKLTSQDAYQIGQAAYQKAAEYARLAITASGAPIMKEGEWLNKTTGFNTANDSWLWYLPQTKEGVTNLVNFIAWRSCEATWGYGGKYVFEGVNTKFYERISATDWRRKAFVGADPEAWYKENGDLTNYTKEQFLEKVSPYANMKFHPAGGNITSSTDGNVTDVPLMRVEEMYFIEAEATAHYDAATGKQLLTSFMENRDSKYSISADKDLIDEIMFQKRVELWGEGIVFYDFKRLNMGINSGYTGTNVPADSRVNTKGRAPWWNFCFPESEELQNTALKGNNNPDPEGLVPLWKE